MVRQACPEPVAGLTTNGLGWPLDFPSERYPVVSRFVCTASRTSSPNSANSSFVNSSPAARRFLKSS